MLSYIRFTHKLEANLKQQDRMRDISQVELYPSSWRLGIHTYYAQTQSISIHIIGLANTIYKNCTFLYALCFMYVPVCIHYRATNSSTSI